MQANLVTHNPSLLPQLQRANGHGKIEFKLRDRQTVLGELYQRGSAKIRLPKLEPTDFYEAVLINTSGGLTDDDIFKIEASWRDGTSAIVTSQAAERIYKSRENLANIITQIDISPDATAMWLPQETILFDAGKFKRDCTIKLHSSSQLLACESLVFGRAAMGEEVRIGALAENWNIYCDNKLIFADRLKLEGNIEDKLKEHSISGGCKAWATVLYYSKDAERYQHKLREISKNTNTVIGCSLRGNLLITRILGKTGAGMRDMLTKVLEMFVRELASNKINIHNHIHDQSDHRAKFLPRVWYC